MRRLPPWHLRLRIREALRHPAESRPPHHQGARSHRPSPIRHRKDLYVALTVCQMVDTSSRVCCIAISSFFSFLSIKFEMFVVNVQAFDAFIGADFLERFTRHVFADWTSISNRHVSVAVQRQTFVTNLSLNSNRIPNMSLSCTSNKDGDATALEEAHLNPQQRLSSYGIFHREQLDQLVWVKWVESLGEGEMTDSGVDELHTVVVAIDVVVVFDLTCERVEEGQGIGERGLDAVVNIIGGKRRVRIGRRGGCVDL
ncbi:hypothetical protein Scep_021065 [Stephania cephalantha]|uniref:Uncharacterized protein n=1 Tax=Stephania cephalantha TaxID=152367 RepID=A0AAP0I147_9MAGN